MILSYCYNWVTLCVELEFEVFLPKRPNTCPLGTVNETLLTATFSLESSLAFFPHDLKKYKTNLFIKLKLNYRKKVFYFALNFPSLGIFIIKKVGFRKN